MYKKLILVLLLCGVGFGTNFTTVSTPWTINDGATFGNTSPGVAGTDYPADGDSVIVDGSDTLIVPTSYTFNGKIGTVAGITGAFTTAIIEGTWNLTGHSRIYRNTNFFVNAGATVNGGYGTNYTVICQGSGGYKYRIRMVGATIKNFAVTGADGDIERNYIVRNCTIDSLAAGTIRSGTGDSTLVDSNVINTYGNQWYLASTVCAYHKISNNTFNNPTGTYVIQTTISKTTSGVTTIENNTFNSLTEKTTRFAYKGSITGNVFNKCGIFFNADSGQFINNLVLSTGTIAVENTGYQIYKNNYFVMNRDNPHFVYNKKGVRFEKNILQAVYPTFSDHGDWFINSDHPDTCYILDNIFITPQSDAFNNSLGSDEDTGRVIMAGNTYLGTVVGTYGPAFKSETVGYPKGMQIINSIFTSRSYNAASQGMDLGTNVNTQFTYLDYNSWYNIAYPYHDDLTIIGIDSGSTGYGGNDLGVYAEFRDTTRHVLTFDVSNGGDGVIANTMSLFLNRTANYTPEKLLGWVRSGFKPQNTAFKGSGLGGRDRGAVQFTITRVDTILSNDTLYVIDSVSSALSITTYGSSDSVYVFLDTGSTQVDSAGLIASGSKCTTAVKISDGKTYFETRIYGSPILGSTFFADTLTVDSITIEGSGVVDTADILTIFPSHGKVEGGDTVDIVSLSHDSSGIFAHSFGASGTLNTGTVLTWNPLKIRFVTADHSAGAVDVIVTPTGGEPDTIEYTYDAVAAFDSVFIDTMLTVATESYDITTHASSGGNYKAYSTLQAAVDDNVKGTHFYMRKQIHNGSTVLRNINGTSWVDGHYQVIETWPADTVGGGFAVFDGEHLHRLCIGDTGSPELELTSHRYWIIRNIEVTNYSNEASTIVEALWINQGPNIIENCYIHDNYVADATGNNPAGLHIYYGKKNIIRNNRFERNGTVYGVDRGADLEFYADYFHHENADSGYCGSEARFARTHFGNIIYNNYFTGSRYAFKYKAGQYYESRRSDVNKNWNLIDWGDKIYHNIVLKTYNAMSLSQDFINVYENVIDSCYYNILVPYDATTYEHYKACIYNNNVSNSPNPAIYYAHGSSKLEWSSLPENNLWGFMANNIADSTSPAGMDYRFVKLTAASCEGCTLFVFDSCRLTNNLSHRTGSGNYITFGTQDSVFIIATLNTKTGRSDVHYVTTGDLYSTDYTANPDFVIDGGSTTIANGGSGGSHPYLPDATLPDYVGAGSGWQAGVLALSGLGDEPVTPIWTVQAENDTITGDGQPVSFHAVHNLDEEINWFEVGVGLALEGSPLEFFASEADTARRFYAVAMWGEGLSDTTDTVKVVLRESSITITTQPASCTTLVGQPLSFFVEATTTGLPISYAMYRFGADTSIYYDSAVTFVATAAHHGDSIRFVAYNLDDTVWSSMAYISVVQIAIDTTLFGDGWYFKNKSGTNWPTSGWEISFVRGTAVGDTLSTTIAGQDGYGFSGIVPSAPLVVRTAPYYVLFTNGVYTIVRRQVFTPLGSSVVVTGKTSSSTSSSPY